MSASMQTGKGVFYALTEDYRTHRFLQAGSFLYPLLAVNMVLFLVFLPRFDFFGFNKVLGSTLLFFSFLLASLKHFFKIRLFQERFWFLLDFPLLIVGSFTFAFSFPWNLGAASFLLLLWIVFARAQALKWDEEGVGSDELNWGQGDEMGGERSDRRS